MPGTATVPAHAPGPGTPIDPGESGISGQPVVGANGDVYVAPALTPPPGSFTDDPAAPWGKLGLISEDGVSWTPPAEDTEDIKAWQSRFPVRIVTTSLTTSMQFTMLEWNRSTLEFSLGGGSWEESGDLVVYRPPGAGAAAEVALFVSVVDGANVYGLYFPKCKITDRGDISFKADEAAGLNVTAGIVGAQGVDPYLLIFPKDVMPPVAGAVTVTAVNPATGAAAGGETVTVTGSGFASGVGQ
jgi:hypothetical protein